MPLQGPDFMNMLTGALAGQLPTLPSTGAAAESGTPASGFRNLSADAWASILGQLAQVIGQGKTVGAGLGQAAQQMGQASIMAKKQSEQRQMLEQFLGGLTGEGVQTQGVTVAPDGSLKVTGTLAAPRTEATGEAAPTQTPTTTATPSPVRDVSLGGGTQTTSPFYQRLQGIFGG